VARAAAVAEEAQRAEEMANALAKGFQNMDTSSGG
jgi:hypothetical protein